MKYGLVIDLGATNLRVAIVNSNHEIVKKVKTNSDKNMDIAFKIFTEYKNMDLDYNVEKVVVAVPGTIDVKNNIIRDLPNFTFYELENNCS